MLSVKLLPPRCGLREASAHSLSRSLGLLAIRRDCVEMRLVASSNGGRRGFPVPRRAGWPAGRHSNSKDQLAVCPTGSLTD